MHTTICHCQSQFCVLLAVAPHLNTLFDADSVIEHALDYKFTFRARVDAADTVREWTKNMMFGSRQIAHPGFLHGTRR